LEFGVSVSEVGRKYDVHPVLPKKWIKNYYENPEETFKGDGKTFKMEARNSELESLVG
jgi:transposase